MVSGSRTEVGPQILSAGVRKTIQSIKEIVGNHSDAEIYVALRETNMDPNETTQKLLSQDPFHEVKRKRDKKKEVSGYKSPVAAEPSINSEVVSLPVKSNAHFGQNARRGGYTRNILPDVGGSKEFRVVRDNRANQNASKDLKHSQSTTSTNERVSSDPVIKSNSAGASGHQKLSVADHSSQALNGPADLQPRQASDANFGGNDRKDLHGEKQLPVSHAASRMQIRTNESRPRSTTSSSSSVLGVYSSSSDPVHVPSFNSRSVTNIGAIKREVGVVGPRRQSSENSGKPPSSQSSSFPVIQSGREGYPRESTRTSSAISKGDQPIPNMATESAIPGPYLNRSFSSNQHGSRPHQLVSRQKALQPNKEWKPKSTLKPSVNGPGVIGTPPKIVSPPADNSEDLKKETDQIQDSMSQLNISENQNVIIAAHIRVSDADRCRLTFGSLGTEFESTVDSVFHIVEGAEESSTEQSRSVSASGTESSTEEPAGGKQLELMDDHVSKSRSNSPASGAASDHQLSENKESLSPGNLDNYVDVGLVRNNSAYSPELLQTQDTSALQSFSSYETQMGYDMPYFRPLVDETVRGPSLPSQQEVLGRTANSIPASSIPMVQQQQQQQQLAQMYPQVHVPHFTNLMPYHRQFISPVYVPPMPVPGYSGTSAYPHPSNGSNYLVMPGNSSHLTASGLKYGVQQYKPVPTGNPTGFGNFTNPSGYAINTPGVVGSATGHEESSRLKYKDSNLYVPNAQAETSEMWINPRDLSSLQPTSYYNMPGPTPHAAYLPNHNGHTSFNAAQSSHMQFPGMYHPPTQATAMASPHHLGAAIGGNVNVGVGVAAAAPGAQPAAYQQPQLGHLSWPGNF
ncbi:GBF-interacting 1-like isoform X1 [Olea europaea subsp. europaea]|uniref:GBF-interacting 1-like isoform X1 n=1 Tax=Olea europaea subsp. europaea TaxID=158383 RepID=A0A8S0RIV4_OLEEU|nr:GBF-interacting 1-like isoform X1 [Olea europaea subsp. europaea]